jgi:hypothetical protein
MCCKFKLTCDWWPGTGCNFHNAGFTAMSHPAEAEIGLTHGVFVLEKNLSDEVSSKSLAPSSDGAAASLLPVRSCRRFLHKPSMELMRQAGAFLSNQQVQLLFII